MSATVERPAAGVTGPASEEAIRIYPHSPALYWWPVWAVGLVMALWTYLDGYHVALVPEGATVDAGAIVAPADADLEAPMVHMARSRLPGVIFAFTLLFTIFLNTASLRGPWSLFGLAVVAIAALSLSLLRWWPPIYHWLGVLRLYLNLGTYLVIAVPLFVMWAVTVFFLDRRTYMVFSTGQVRIRDELGESEKVHDTMLVSFEKEPYDWLRYVVGLGAGDLRVRVGGAQPAVYAMPNVVGIGAKMRKIEERLRTRDVI